MLIAHRCQTCQHPDYWRRQTNAGDGRGACACGHNCEPSHLSEPVQLPTFDVTGARVERVLAPGTQLGADLPGGAPTAVVTCTCAACTALYESLTTVGAAPAPPSTAGPSPRQIRKWAAEVGMQCPRTGRVPAHVAEAYATAHN
ncbi:Lsr2 family DNA-binding protein [Actinomadura terrae]|uniref:Lsr2 family DNA-binding protein n=1 Tax=Actinomadura terrae TaxID=604353 RepID=UPI001FA77B8D|nr:histone-like nucleoid-structuring protein Lsr2 [Actinomadura terrae]